MAHYKYLIFCLLLASGSSFAGYAQLAPPPGWSQGGSAATFNFAKAAGNEASFLANTVRTSAALNVGGRSVTMPVAMRFAANAGRVGAAASYGNPSLFAALTVASLGYSAYRWYVDNDVEVKDGKWVKKTESDGVECASGCAHYRFDGSNPWVYSVASAAAQGIGVDTGYGRRTSVISISGQWVQYSLNDGAAGDRYDQMFGEAIPPYNTKSTRYDELTRQQFEDEMAPNLMPDAVPKSFPVPVEWPVEQPLLNPSPGLNPASQPLRVPQGEPQPVPNSNPQQWKTPVVDVVPAPTPSSPWQVDLQPKDIVKTDASPVTQPDVPPAPGSDPGTPTEKTPGLCDLYPDILACAKPEFNTPDSDPLDTKDKVISIAPDSGWGAASASCPAPRHLPGANVDFFFEPMCDGLGKLRPIIIAVAWLSAALIALGVKGGGS